ncbi:hypothetical protein C5167_027878 [Papaver somniferum]|nr:hypothetical protein C5167_027878 [Papaver somniferum]
MASSSSTSDHSNCVSKESSIKRSIVHRCISRSFCPHGAYLLSCYLKMSFPRLHGVPVAWFYSVYQ